MLTSILTTIVTAVLGFISAKVHSWYAANQEQDAVQAAEAAKLASEQETGRPS